MIEYHIGTVSDVYGTQRGDCGGSQNYCYIKTGFVQDSRDGQKYFIENICRREIPFDCKDGLSRKVYWNKNQKVLFRLVDNTYHYPIGLLAHNCGINHNFNSEQVAIILGVINKKNQLIVADDDSSSSGDYTLYRKIPLEEFLKNPDEKFLRFYSAG